MGLYIEGNKLVKYEEDPDVFEVKIPESVNDIDYGAFMDCKNLKKKRVSRNNYRIKELVPEFVFRFRRNSIKQRHEDD